LVYLLVNKTRSQADLPQTPGWKAPAFVTVVLCKTVKRTLLLLLAGTLAMAINATAQITSSGSGDVPASGNYAPGYSPGAAPLPDADTAAAQTHLPETASLIAGCIMLVPLAVSLVRVFRKRHVIE
jgi:hypothetical protein